MKRQTAAQAFGKCAAYIGMFFGMQLAVQFLVILLIGFSSAVSGREIDLVSASYRVLYETMILAGLLFLGLIALLKKKSFFEETRIKKAPASSLFAGTFMGFGAYALVLILIVAMTMLLPAVQQSQDTYMEEQILLQSTQPAFWAELVYVCLAAPFLEELLCRGLILNTLKKNFKPGIAILISGSLFALIHGNLYQGVFTLPLGLLMGWLAHRFDSIWPSVLTHIAFNFSNYPVMICLKMGYSEESAVTNTVALILTVLCYASIPAGILLALFACKKNAPPADAILPLEARTPIPAVPPTNYPYNNYPYNNFPNNFPPNNYPPNNYPPNNYPPNNYPPNNYPPNNFPPNNYPPYYPPTSYTPYYPPMNTQPMDPAAQFSPDQVNTGGSMASPKFLIVGLGNPGDKYAQNRHNAGFMALDYIALRESVSINNLRFKALTGEGVICGEKVLFMKPQTFMNLSGEAVREAAAFYKIPAENILVIFDDINFEPGVFRIRESGSAGGHNGIKSIISCLGTEAFPRVKVGVGTPPPQWELMNWVLANPAPDDQKKIIASLEDVYSTVKHFTAGNLDRAAALYNGKKHE